MNAIFWLLFGYCLAERLFELFVSRRNQRSMKERGFSEKESASGMRAMIILHGSWYVGILLERLFTPTMMPMPLWTTATAVFLAAQAVRFWTLRTLGSFWNISVMTTDSDAPLFVSEGPYRYIRHPNYLVVIIELATLPVIGNAPYVAVFFTILNALLLRRRITLEEAHLFSISGYKEEMASKARFIPGIV
jgi:methyltransferase